MNKQFKVSVPEIKKVAVPNIPDFSGINFKVDTSKIDAVVEAGLANKRKVDRDCLFARLSCFKAKTVSLNGTIIALSEADRADAQKVINRLNAEKILDEGNKKWAIEHGLAV